MKVTRPNPTIARPNPKSKPATLRPAKQASMPRPLPSVPNSQNKIPMSRVNLKKAPEKTKKRSAVGKAFKTAKKVAKTAKDVASVGYAAYKLAKDIANPKNIAKSLGSQGIVLPGSKYIGPGNSIDKGAPVSKGDAIAYQHDLEYDKLLGKAKHPSDVYLGYSHADNVALKEAWRHAKKGDAHSLAVAAGLGIKKLAYKSGLTKKQTKHVKQLERPIF